MYSIKEISTQLGLSHSEMANLPGIIRSMLAKAETRDRRLDSITLLKLAAFENSVREAYSDDTNADLSISYCKNRLRDNSLALKNLEVKQEKMQRCCVIGKDLPIAVLGCEHQKRVERRYMNCGSAVRQIGEIKKNQALLRGVQVAGIFYKSAFPATNFKALLTLTHHSPLIREFPLNRPIRNSTLLRGKRYSSLKGMVKFANLFRWSRTRGSSEVFRVRNFEG